MILENSHKSMEKTKRQSRYIRPSKDKIANLVLHSRDLEIIQIVYDYRFLRTDHITSLIEGDRTSIEKRLRKLWEHRYLERSFIPMIFGKEDATRRAIYSIDYRGANLLMKHKGADPKHLKHVLRHNKPENSYVEHQLMATQFRIVLTLALAQTKQAKILFWRQDKEIRDHVELLDNRGRKKRFPIAPDGYFALEDERGKMYWFLEVDRYTMDHRRWLNKMKAYYHWWEEKRHTEKLGIKNFRVLAICPTATNRDARLEITKRVKIIRDGNQEEPVGIKIFWFVSEEDYNLNKPSTLLEPIFHVARQNEENSHMILE